MENYYTRLNRWVENTRKEITRTYVRNLWQINTALACGLIAFGLNTSVGLRPDTEYKTAVEIASKNGRQPSESELQFLTKLDRDWEMMETAGKVGTIGCGLFGGWFIASRYRQSRGSIKNAFAADIEKTNEKYLKDLYER